MSAAVGTGRPPGRVGAVGASVHHELVKLLTLRSTYVGAATVVVLSALLATLTARALGLAGSVADSTGVVHLVLRTSTPALVMAAVLGAASVRGELRDGVLRLTVLAAPARRGVLLAKGLALGVVTGCVAAVSALAAIGAVQLTGKPVPPGTWVVGALAHVLVALGWSVAGMCAGVLVPHVAGAVAVTLALPFAVEPALAASLPGSPVTTALPFRSALSAYDVLDHADAVTASGTLPGPLALAPFVVAAAGALLLSARHFARMDL